MDIKKKILVVDDDRFAREMLRAILTREGYDLVFAEDGAKAVEMAAVEKPDLVLTDGLLPKLHGFVVCKTLKSWEDAPKVVLLTAIYTKPTYRWEVKKEYGADDILSKPVRSDALIACIRKHLGEECAKEGGASEAAGAAVAKAGTTVTATAMEGPATVTGFSVVPAA